MNIIKTIINYRNQQPHEVLFKHQHMRVNDNIATTRHLIKYYLHRSGIKNITQERHLKKISGGFDHTSVTHSLSIVNAQNFFSPMLADLDKLITLKN
ncbi:MAG: hypothetical protein Q8O72_10515 [Bacteroidales bacterium]|nr:hypothetical protein [Bacteroidales bacterium]